MHDDVGPRFPVLTAEDCRGIEGAKTGSKAMMSDQTHPRLALHRRCGAAATTLRMDLLLLAVCLGLSLVARGRFLEAQASGGVVPRGSIEAGATLALGKSRGGDV